MKTLRMVLHIMNKQKKGYLLLSFEIVLTAIILLSFIGKMQYSFSTKNVTDTFKGSNSFYFTGFSFYKSDEYPLKKILNEKADFKFKLGEVTDIYFKDDNNNTIYAYGYNDLLIEYTNLQLEEGMWLNQQQNKNEIPVIALNDKYQVGDVIQIPSQTSKDIYSARIIGKIVKNSYILSFQSGASNDFANVDNFVTPAYADIIIPYESDNTMSIPEDVCEYTDKQSGTIIMVGDNSVYDEVYQICNNYGNISNISIMVENYTNNMRDYYLTNGIILIVFTILTLVGIGGFNGIQSILFERVYTVYYMLGLSKLRCVIIEVMKIVILLILNYSIIILLYLWKLKNLFPKESFKITPITFIAIFILLAVICFSASIGYVVQLAKKNLMQVYKEKA